MCLKKAHVCLLVLFVLTQGGCMSAAVRKASKGQDTKLFVFDSRYIPDDKPHPEYNHWLWLSVPIDIVTGPLQLYGYCALWAMEGL